MTGQLSCQFQFQKDSQNCLGWRITDPNQLVDSERGWAQGLFNGRSYSVDLDFRYYWKRHRAVSSGIAELCPKDRP